jgi:predicted RNase H-like HicB family nuclease
MELTIRCFAERKADQWQAFSLEFGLAVQGDSYLEVRQKLEAMIEEYLEDALGGQDKKHAEVLLSRKAAFSVYWKYHVAGLQRSLGAFVRSSSEQVQFREPFSLTPRHCPAG